MNDVNRTLPLAVVCNGVMCQVWSGSCTVCIEYEVCVVSVVCGAPLPCAISPICDRPSAIAADRSRRAYHHTSIQTNESMSQFKIYYSECDDLPMTTMTLWSTKQKSALIPGRDCRDHGQDWGRVQPANETHGPSGKRQPSPLQEKARSQRLTWTIANASRRACSPRK